MQHVTHVHTCRRAAPSSTADAPVDAARRHADKVPALQCWQVLLLARRREAAGLPAMQQPALALEAESVESTSTQVGRKTAEQFALADGDAAKVTGTKLCPHWACIPFTDHSSSNISRVQRVETTETWCMLATGCTIVNLQRRPRRRKHRTGRRGEQLTPEANSRPSSAADGDQFGSEEEVCGYL